MSCLGVQSTALHIKKYRHKLCKLRKTFINLLQILNRGKKATLSRILSFFFSFFFLVAGSYQGVIHWFPGLRDWGFSSFIVNASNLQQPLQLARRKSLLWLFNVLKETNIIHDSMTDLRMWGQILCLPPPSNITCLYVFCTPVPATRCDRLKQSSIRN